jgi:predicted membrane GTPase involved in stress response
MDSFPPALFTLDYDNYVGRIGIARIFNGKVKKGEEVTLVKANGEKINGRITKLSQQSLFDFHLNKE